MTSLSRATLEARLDLAIAAWKRAGEPVGGVGRIGHRQAGAAQSQNDFSKPQCKPICREDWKRCVSD